MRQRSYGRDTGLTLRIMFTMFMLGIVWVVFMGLLFGAGSQRQYHGETVLQPSNDGKTDRKATGNAERDGQRLLFPGVRAANYESEATRIGILHGPVRANQDKER